MSELYIESKTFVNVSFTDNTLERGEYEYCTFKDCNFAESDLSHIVFMECAFIDCDMSMVKLHETSFQQVIFDQCKMIGIYFEHLSSFLLEVHFKACSIDHASFYGMNLTKCTFRGIDDQDLSSMNNVDFTEADLSGIIMAYCNLLGAKFESTKLIKTDLSTSLDFEIDPEINKIRGLKVSQNNLENLLKKHNLKIV